MCRMETLDIGEPMKTKEKRDVREIGKMLVELDDKSLALIESGVRLLASRQKMETPKKRSRRETKK